MIKEKNINLDILPHGTPSGEIVEITTPSAVPDVDEIKLTQRRRTKAPNRVFSEMIKAERGETKINASEVRRQFGTSPEIEFMLKKRRGPRLNENDKLLLIKMYQWLNGQSINYTDVNDPKFLCNETTGERGAVIIGYVNADGETVIRWPELAADFYGMPKPTSNKEISAIKNYTDTFRRTVNDFCNKKDKQFIGVYDEIQPDGRATRLYKIISPMNFHYSERDGKTYAVLQLNDYFTDNGQSFVMWRTLGANFFNQFRKLEYYPKATISLIFELITLTATSKKNAKIDKGETAEMKKNGNTKNVFVMEKRINLRRLLKTICNAAIEKGKHEETHRIFCHALKNARDLGFLHQFDGDDDGFNDWIKTGAKPTKYKTFADFYKQTNVILFIKKEY